MTDLSESMPDDNKQKVIITWRRVLEREKTETIRMSGNVHTGCSLFWLYAFWAAFLLKALRPSLVCAGYV